MLEEEVASLKKRLKEAAEGHMLELDVLASKKFIQGEESMKAKVENAWELGPHNLAPFRYFEKRIAYQEKLQEAA